MESLNETDTEKGIEREIHSLKRVDHVEKNWNTINEISTKLIMMLREEFAEINKENLQELKSRWSLYVNLIDGNVGSEIASIEMELTKNFDVSINSHIPKF